MKIIVHRLSGATGEHVAFEPGALGYLSGKIAEGGGDFRKSDDFFAFQYSFIAHEILEHWNSAVGRLIAPYRENLKKSVDFY